MSPFKRSSAHGRKFVSSQKCFEISRNTAQMLLQRDHVSEELDTIHANDLCGDQAVLVRCASSSRSGFEATFKQ